MTKRANRLGMLLLSATLSLGMLIAPATARSPAPPTGTTQATPAAVAQPVTATGHSLSEGATRGLPAAKTATGKCLGTNAATALQVEIAQISPAILQQEDQVTVTGSVTNCTAQLAEKVQLKVALGTYTPVYRHQLQQWLLDSSLPTAQQRLVASIDAPLPPNGLNSGDTVPFSISIPRNKLPLHNVNEWGPRLLNVSAYPPAGSDIDAGATHSFLLWDSGVKFQPSGFSVLLPLSPTAEELAKAPQNIAGFTTGSLARIQQLLPTSTVKGVITALDSALVDQQLNLHENNLHLTTSVNDVNAVAVPTATAVVNQAASQLLQAIKQNPPASLAILPWGNLEPTELEQDSTGRLLQQSLQAQESTRAALASNGMHVDSLAWALGTVYDQNTATLWPNQPVVVGSSGLRANTELNYTPDSSISQAQLSTTDNAPNRLLTVDAALSAALSGQVKPKGSDATAPADDAALLTELNRGNPTGVSISDFTADQYLLAQLALLTRERPNDSRNFIASLPLNVANTPALQNRLNRVFSARWVQAKPLTDLLTVNKTKPLFNPAVKDNRYATQLAPYTSVKGQLTPINLKQSSNVVNQVNQISAALPGDAAAQIRRYIAQLELLQTSQGWQQNPDLRQVSLRYFATVPGLLKKSVSAERSSTINLISSPAQIPVRLTNHLNVPVTVRVKLRPNDLRLQPQKPQVITLPANGSSTAQLTVNSVGSGDVEAQIVLETSDGVLFNDDTVLDIRVRANWESTGTIIIGSVLVVMLIAGLIRTFRRGRRVTEPDSAAYEAGGG